MDDNAKLNLYMRSVVDGLSGAKEEVVDALNLIASLLDRKGSPLPLQLLALRRYLRIGGKRLEANWSWTEAQAKTKANQEPGVSLYAEANKVQDIFARQNPGYALAVSPIRSLEKQVLLWNRNDSVQAAGTKLLRDMEQELSKASYPARPTGEASARFRTKLSNAYVTPEPTNAAPGTSDHGRGNAVDFAVMKGRTTIAGTNVSQIADIWKKQGWEKKLIEVCKGTKLTGPLATPYEPWHWVLRP